MLKTKTTSKTHLESLLKKEWLISNKRGGFACGTLANCNTRRYHSLLTGSMIPPAKRIKGLVGLEETIITDEKSYELSNFEFNDVTLSGDSITCNNFYQDQGVNFEYELDLANITKSIYLDSEEDRIAIVYNFSEVAREFTLRLRPFAAINDFHSLLKSDAKFCSFFKDGELIISSDVGQQCELRMYGDKMMYRKEEAWWYNFNYRIEKQRGQDHLEDLWSPGYFDYNVEGPERVVFWASISEHTQIDRLSDLDVDIFIDNLAIETKNVLGNSLAGDELFKKLCLSADRFVVNREISGKETATILAGFPWFLDWGRDTFIALGGLLLETGRFEQARQVLCTFASAVDEGMIPNRFDDYNNQPHYNSIDASLWFIDAAFNYYDASNDKDTFTNVLLPVIKWITEAYHSGTRFGICADSDGLLMGGSANTQLTWMDAKCDGVAFTPRYGKAVEINALWHNAICNLAQYYKTKNPDSEETQRYTAMADEIEDSFRKVFYNEQLGYLYDCVFDESTKDASIRPNQIFAVSLKHSPLSISQQESVVDTVEKHLLTPFGLRTLSPADADYKGKYQGDMFTRDSAYHQGTAWAWLMGPFIKAYLRVNNNSFSAKAKALEMLRPLLDHFENQGCINSVSEIFDGDSPHKPRGCFAQAWSVASLIESYRLTTLSR